MRYSVSHCQLQRSLDKLSVEEEVSRYNVEMFDITTEQPDRGEEVTRSGETINVAFLRDVNFWQGNSLLAQDRTYFREIMWYTRNEFSFSRQAQENFEFYFPKILFFAHASALIRPSAAHSRENVVRINIRNLNIPTQQGLQEWGKSFKSWKPLAVGGYAVGKPDLGS